jgi:pSer/pThr/pTyr-binding forkhead associated (FHA) protein
MQVVLQITQGASPGRLLLLPPGQYLFGRDPDCHVQLPAASVSRRHCFLYVTEQGASLHDLDSRNSTAINSERITGERPLKEGDRIYLAGTEFLVRINPTIHRGQELIVVPGQPRGETIACRPRPTQAEV